MLANKALTLLKKANYAETTDRTSLGGDIAHIVYLVAQGDDGDIMFYTQATRAVRSNFKKFKQWLATGDTKHLPIPIQRCLPFTNTGAPANYVKAFSNTCRFLDFDLTHKLKVAGYSALWAKERTSGPYVSVYKVGLTGDERFKIVVSKGTPKQVLSQFISKSKEQTYCDYPTTAMGYRGFCVYNERRLDSKNATIETLASGLIPGAGKLWAKMYLDTANPALILNSKW